MHITMWVHAHFIISSIYVDKRMRNRSVKIRKIAINIRGYTDIFYSLMVILEWDHIRCICSQHCKHPG